MKISMVRPTTTDTGQASSGNAKWKVSSFKLLFRTQFHVSILDLHDSRWSLVLKMKIMEKKSCFTMIDHSFCDS